jgi:hypothetical protein
MNEVHGSFWAIRNAELDATHDNDYLCRRPHRPADKEQMNY